MRKDLEFLKERNNQIKQEIKERKQWKNSLIKIYCQARTTDLERKHLAGMVEVADIMINHYEAILEEHKKMIKELEEVK